MSPAFVFLHVGPAVEMPTLLVRSLRLFHPDAQVIQCTDLATPEISGVSAVNRVRGDTTHLMTYRLLSFARLQREEPALYMDTDMLCVAPIDPPNVLGGCDVAVCNREFSCGALINTRFNGLDLGEYEGRTLGQVYPYVACATITRSAGFWEDCLANLQTLHRKFHTWYGDQEAIRNVLAWGKYKVGLLPESVYGLLPDAHAPKSVSPRLLHFKGPHRKPLMLEFAKQLRIAH